MNKGQRFFSITGKHYGMSFTYIAPASGLKKATENANERYGSPYTHIGDVEEFDPVKEWGELGAKVFRKLAEVWEDYDKKPYFMPEMREPGQIVFRHDFTVFVTPLLAASLGELAKDDDIVERAVKAVVDKTYGEESEVTDCNQHSPTHGQVVGSHTYTMVERAIWLARDPEALKSAISCP